MPLIPIPTRFENILASEALEPAPLLVRVEEDLQFFDRLRRYAEGQHAGVIAFPVGESGSGKTTAVHSAAAFMPERFAGVISVPATVPLREAPLWFSENLPAREERVRLVLLDGREASDDRVGLRQLMSDLNQRLRGRPDLIVCWPTVDPEWHAELSELASKIGGEELAPSGHNRLVGPPPDEWPEVLNRILIQLDHDLDDLALDEEFVRAAAREETNVGRFLGRISKAVAGRVDEVRLSQGLPRVVFVVTSISDVVGEANRLRRAGSYLLKAHELTSYSSRSAAGKYWRARAGAPEHNLGYVIALFRATLTTMTPSSVVYACAEYGDDDLKQYVKEQGIARSLSNATRTFQNTDFHRLLIGEPSRELTSTMKGKTAASTLAAHGHIQEASAKRHKAINQAICQLAESVVPEFKASLGNFEVDLGEQDAYADAVIPLDGDDIHLELHHLSGAHCKASSIASYIMDKLKVYAIRHNIVPR